MNALHCGLRAVGLGAVVLALSGCAIVSSGKLDRAEPSQTNIGIPYMLPKAVVPYQVVASGTQIRVDLQEPSYVGDPSQVFALSYQANAFSTDTLTISVDPATSLLKSVTLESTDETLEILKKAIATIRAEAAESGTVLAQGIIDPGSMDSIAAAELAISSATTAYLTIQKAKCSQAPGGAGCTEIAALDLQSKVTIGVNLMGSTTQDARRAQSFGAAAASAGKGVDCTAGICIRGTLPYEVSIVALGQRHATLVQLPNDGPVMALPMTRYPFVKTTHTVALKNGMLEQYDLSKPSSGLALVSWPIAVYDEIVTTTAKIIQLKIDTSTNDLKLQEQMVADAEKRKELKDRLDKLLARAESAGMTTSSKTLLSVAAGAPVSMTPNIAGVNQPPSPSTNLNPTLTPTPILKSEGNDGMPGK